MVIDTDRLQLVAGSLSLVEAELQDRVRFAELLGAQVPGNWPPPLNDAATMEWCRRYLKEKPDEVGWVNWYFVLRSGINGQRAAIGNGGFRGKPDGHGITEVGYSILPDFQDTGYATEALGGLLRWAFSHSETTRIIAQTYPNLKQSIRVLEKNGFAAAGYGSGPGVIRYELVRNRLKQ